MNLNHFRDQFAAIKPQCPDRNSLYSKLAPSRHVPGHHAHNVLIAGVGIHYRSVPRCPNAENKMRQAIRPVDFAERRSMYP